MLFTAEVVTENTKDKTVSLRVEGCDEKETKQRCELVTIHSANYFDKEETWDKSCRIHWNKQAHYEKTSCTGQVEIPYTAIRELSIATKTIGNPLYAQVIDLSPNNQKKISDEYANKTGMFKYLKNNAPAIT